MKYDAVFKDQWTNICKKIKSLNPDTEDELVDIVVKIFNNYPLLKLHVESKVYRYSDVKYFKIKRNDRFESDTHCIFAGVQILSDRKNKQDLIKESKNIIKYLYDKFGDGTCVRNKLIIYDKTNTITNDDINYLENCQRKDGVKIHHCL